MRLCFFYSLLILGAPSLQANDASQWQTLFKGYEVGDQNSLNTPAVTALQQCLGATGSDLHVLLDERIRLAVYKEAPGDLILSVWSLDGGEHELRNPLRDFFDS